MAVTVPTGGHFLPQLRAATPIITCNALKVSLFVPVVKREFCGEAKKDLAGSSARGGAKTVGAEGTPVRPGKHKRGARRGMKRKGYTKARH